MINSNLRLVVSIAKRYQGATSPARPDPGGIIGLIRAVEKFDWRARLQVLDLCHLVDPAGDQRGIANGAHDPDPGAHRRARAEDRPRERELTPAGREPTEEELARPALPSSRSHEVRGAPGRSRASTSPRRGRGVARRPHRRRRRRSPRRRSRGACAGRRCARAFASCPSASGRSIKLPGVGLNGDAEPKSLEEIGRVLQLTRERVRQIETKALERLAVSRELGALEAA